MEGTSTGSYNLVNTMWAVANCWQLSRFFHGFPQMSLNVFVYRCDGGTRDNYTIYTRTYCIETICHLSHYFPNIVSKLHFYT